jgi:hypothetical protein
MKKIIFIFLFVAIASTSFGQYGFDLGIKAGLTNSKITVNSSDFNSSTINSYHLGAFARINFDRVYIQPEAYYSSKGGNIDYILSSNPLQTVSEFNYDAVDVPVLFGVNILKGKALKLRAMGGPMFSFITDNSVRTGNNKISAQYTFDARIENSAGQVYSSDYLNGRNKTLLLSVGIKIL